MSFDNAIAALSVDALKYVKEGQVIGLGSGRAATSFVNALSNHLKKMDIEIKAVPTSIQIKLIAEKNEIPLIEADQVDFIDVVFDGADQIDSHKYLIKGGGGALLRENILISASKKVVIMADKTKFVRNFNRSIPIEVHPAARRIVGKSLTKLGGKPKIRTIERGYPFITENGNIILDCDFGTVKEPKSLSQRIRQLAGVMEVGIFLRKPDIIYKANSGGKYQVIS